MSEPSAATTYDSRNTSNNGTTNNNNVGTNDNRQRQGQPDSILRTLLPSLSSSSSMVSSVAVAGHQFENDQFSQIYSIINSDTLPLETKTDFLKGFKGHIKKEFINTKLTQLYLDALLLVPKRYPPTENQQKAAVDFTLLAHSTLCYLIKRVSIQTPEYFSKSLVDVLVPYLIDTQNTIQTARNRFVDGHFVKKFWLLTVKIFETVYGVCSVLLEESLRKQLLKEGLNCINHIKLMLLVINELCSAKGRNSSLLLRKFFPTWVSLLNKPLLTESEELETVCELILDIIKRNSNRQTSNVFIMQLNDQVKPTFLKLVAQSESSERDSFDGTSITMDGNVFDETFELETIQKQSVIPHLSNTIGTEGDKSNSTQYSSIHNLLTEFTSLLVPFHAQRETEQNWRIRQKNTIAMRERLISNESLICGNKAEFVSTLKQVNFIEYISRGALSLRTTLSLNTCQLIKCLIELLGDDLTSNLLDQIFTIFKTLLSSTKKISSQIAYHCLVTMFIDIGFHTKLFQNCFLLINEKNVLPRNTSAVLLRIFIIKFNSSPKLDTNLVYINEWLKKGISDAQTTVRESMRLTFWYFYKAYPDHAKNLLNSAFSTHLKKAIELSIPEHLNIDYERQYRLTSSSSSTSSSFTTSVQPQPQQQQQRRASLLSNSSTSSAGSSKKPGLLNAHGSLNAKRKYPSYAQPTKSSTTFTNLKHPPTSIRSSSDSVSKAIRPLSPADEQLTNKKLRTNNGETFLLKRKVSAPPPLGVMDDTQQFDLTEELSATSSLKLINKYMVTTQSDSITPNDFNSFCRLFEDEVSYKNSLLLLQKYLLQRNSSHEDTTEDNFERLLPKLRHIFVKYPLEVKNLLTIRTFVKHLPLNYTLELFSINDLSPADLLSTLGISNMEEFHRLIEGISTLLTDLTSTHVPELTIYYMKYRFLMFNFTMNLLLTCLTPKISPLSRDTFQELQTKGVLPWFENLLTLLFGIEGGEFDTQLYYDLLFTCYKLNNPIFLSALRSLNFISIKLKTAHEFQKRDPSLELDGIIPNSSDTNGAKDDKDTHSGAAETITDDDDFDVKKYMEMTMVNPFSQANRSYDRTIHEETSVVKPEHDNDTVNPKLYGMTKVVSVYQDLKPSSPTSDEEPLKSESEGGLDLKAIFENNENSEYPVEPIKNEPRHTVKFTSKSPELIGNHDNVKEESTEGNISAEEIKVDDSAHHDSEPPYTSNKIKSEDEGKSWDSVHSLEIIGFTDHSPHTILNEFSSSVMTFYEISKLLSQINLSSLKEYDDKYAYEFEHMMRGITRIKDGAFAIKHVNYLIEPLITFSPQSTQLISWLEEENGYNDLLELSYMLLQSSDDSSLVPTNIIRKSILLVQCVLIVNKIQGNGIGSLDPLILSNIWDQMVVITSKLQENNKDILTLIDETRDTLASLDFFTAKLVTNILSALVSELPEDSDHKSGGTVQMNDMSATQSGMIVNTSKATFLLKTLACILKSGSLELKKLQIAEIVQTLSFLISSRNPEWAFCSTYTLSKLYSKLVDSEDFRGPELNQMFSCLDAGHFKLVKIMASYGDK